MSLQTSDCHHQCDQDSQQAQKEDIKQWDLWPKNGTTNQKERLHAYRYRFNIPHRHLVNDTCHENYIAELGKYVTYRNRCSKCLPRPLHTLDRHIRMWFYASNLGKSNWNFLHRNIISVWYSVLCFFSKHNTSVENTKVRAGIFRTHSGAASYCKAHYYW